MRRYIRGDIFKMEAKYLKDWENDMNRCIRCAYCFEGCPVYRDLRWEPDGARGKVILSYGLLTGQLEPSQYVADKIYRKVSIVKYLFYLPSILYKRFTTKYTKHTKNMIYSFIFRCESWLMDVYMKNVDKVRQNMTTDQRIKRMVNGCVVVFDPFNPLIRCHILIALIRNLLSCFVVPERGWGFIRNLLSCFVVSKRA